jgi:hypothetical protein
MIGSQDALPISPHYSPLDPRHSARLRFLEFIDQKIDESPGLRARQMPRRVQNPGFDATWSKALQALRDRMDAGLPIRRVMIEDQAARCVASGARRDRTVPTVTRRLTGDEDTATASLN